MVHPKLLYLIVILIPPRCTRGKLATGNWHWVWPTFYSVFVSRWQQLCSAIPGAPTILQSKTVAAR